MERRLGSWHDAAYWLGNGRVSGFGWVRIGVVGVVQARQAVGNNLCGGLRSGLSGSLSGGDAGSFGLLFGCRCPNGQVFLRLLRQLGLRAGDDQNLLKLKEVGGGAKGDQCIRLVIRIGCNRLNGAHLQTTRVDLIAARGEDLLARLNARIRGKVIDLDAPRCAPAEDSANAPAEHPRPRFDH